MSQKYQTDQEAFWAGEFGDHYINRNKDKIIVSSNIMFFSKILARTGQIDSVIEFGANIGLNLMALRQLVPSVKLAAVEINKNASKALSQIQGITVHQESILDFTPQEKFDLALIKGVLIHIAPEKLPDIYSRLYQASSKYILLAEYYNPSPVEVPYRGHKGKLFKRDFAGEMLENYPQLKLIDYGFVYHRDPFPQDDMNWFLLEKQEL